MLKTEFFSFGFGVSRYYFVTHWRCQTGRSFYHISGNKKDYCYQRVMVSSW
jgi:hypothetical protein